MKKTTSIMVLVTLVYASAARAQTSEPTRVFIDFNVGLQPQSRTIDTTLPSFPLYDETATVTTSQTVGKRAIFDARVGYRLFSQLGVAVGYSTYSRTGPIAATASIPSPLFFNRPATVAAGVSSTKRNDSNVYLLAVWFMPITEHIEVAFSAGPSGTRVRQDFIKSVTVPVGTQTVTPVVGGETGRAWGVNVGVDGIWLVTKNFGGGIFIRYNGSTVDLPSASNLKTGGFQAGLGARVRF